MISHPDSYSCSLSRRSPIARYCEEEFSSILPETDLKGATIFAERVRKRIKATVIAIDNINIQVTASMGIAVYDPNKSRRNKDEFSKAADKALYN